MGIQFPSHCEPLVRAALLSALEGIPMGQDVPMSEIVFLEAGC